MSLIANLADVQRGISFYGLSILLVLGTVGNLLLICILLQRTHRRNPCSLYLLLTAIVNLILILCLLPAGIYSADNIEPQTYSLVWCKIRSYLFNILLMLYRYYKIAACADRAALCSSRASVRAFNNIRVARRVIFIITIIWLVIPIHILIFIRIESNRCGPQSGNYAIFFTIYTIIVSSWSPPIAMIILAIIAVRNLRQIKARINPMNTDSNQAIHTEHFRLISKRDQQSIRLVICEIIVYLLTNMTYSIYTAYMTITAGNTKTYERIRIEQFINGFISPFLIIINNCIPFYLFLLVSSKFRKDLKQFFHC